MYFASASIWNEIAAAGNLQTQWAKDRFSMHQEELIEALEAESARMEAHGVASSAVRLGYLTVKPLLLENVAISQFIMDTERMGLRNALPDICTVFEAVMLTAMDHPMDEDEQQQLTELLEMDFLCNGDEDEDDSLVIPQQINTEMILKKSLLDIRRTFQLIEDLEPYDYDEESDCEIFAMPEDLKRSAASMLENALSKINLAIEETQRQQQ